MPVLIFLIFLSFKDWFGCFSAGFGAKVPVFGKINGAQTRRIVKGEAQKSPLF